MNVFKTKRDRLIQVLIFCREYLYTDELDLEYLEETLYDIVDLYAIKYESEIMLWDELLWLNNLVYSCNLYESNLDDLYMLIARVLILTEAIDNRAKELWGDEIKCLNLN